MKKIILGFSFVLMTVAIQIPAFSQWAPAGDKIKTGWAETVDPSSVHPEYPRPLLVRGEWMNLNGLWNYAIRPAGQAAPDAFDGEILVPFPVESSLSGVQKMVGRENELWYERTFTVPAGWKNRDILLHFGAVDWRTEVMINDIHIGSHEGGFTSYSFNITPYLSAKGSQKLTVRVWDPTDDGYQPRGKQVNRPNGIWYTPVTGIWQTVWLEPVAERHISSVVSTPDLDNGYIAFEVDVENAAKGDVVEVTVLSGGQRVGSSKLVPGGTGKVSIAEPRLWSPDDPFLYDVKLELVNKGRIIDRADSYTAMRKISTARDAKGILRMTLNNEPLFHFGPLDQGWWPDGLYTAPSDEALLYDIIKTKELGYNMIRKHVKVEPARWYYHCDRLGILVWQDMPSGDMGNQWDNRNYNGGTDKNRNAQSKENFMAEWKGIMDFCRPYPCVVVWVPFNEAWGQFDTEIVSDWTSNYDPSRLVNPASGGNFRMCGDILDLHNYPGPAMYLFDPLRVNVLGEYGGIGLALDGHLWWNERNWGYVQFKTAKEVTDEYVKYARELEQMVRLGFAGAVYTQTTDVEGEVNGLITYDRKVVKVEEDRVREANRNVINAMKSD